MTRRNTYILACSSAIAVLVVGWLMYSSMYAGPRADLVHRLDTMNGTISRQSAETRKLNRAEKSLKEIAATTLGGSYEIVDHRLKTLLMEIGTQNGLVDPKISSRNPQARRNPASEAREPKEITRQLKDQFDFSVVSATFEAQGPLESVLRVAETIGIQPWAHRVDVLDIKPVNTERKAFLLVLSLQTILMPDLVAADVPMPDLVSISSDRDANVVRVAASSPFLLPPPKVEPKAVETPKPQRNDPPRPVDPEEKFRAWRVTGVVRRPGPVMEAWLINTKNNSTRVLQVGEKVAGATLVEASADVAVLGPSSAPAASRSQAAPRPKTR